MMSYRLVDTKDWFVSTEKWENKAQAELWLSEYQHRKPAHEIWSDDQIATYLTDRYAYQCRLAIEVQDACNFSGVTLGFARAMADIRSFLDYTQGGWYGKIEKHPAIILWVDKINDLMGRPAERSGMEYYSKATDECERIVAEHQAAKDAAKAAELKQIYGTDAA